MAAMDIEKVYALYREYIQHQYDLINHRTTWYVGLQAFLFASFGVVIQKKLEIIEKVVSSLPAPSETVRPGYTQLCNVKTMVLCKNIGYLDSALAFFCLTGIVSGIIFWLVINAASEPIRDLYNLWEKIRESIDEDVKSVFPHLTGGLDDTYAHLGRTITKSLPVMLGVIWILVLLATFVLPLMDENREFLQQAYPAERLKIVIGLSIGICFLVFGAYKTGRKVSGRRQEKLWELPRPLPHFSVTATSAPISSAPNVVIPPLDAENAQSGNKPTSSHAQRQPGDGNNREPSPTQQRGLFNPRTYRRVTPAFRDGTHSNRVTNKFE